MSEHIHKNHNKSLLLYHLVCPIKYRRSVLSNHVEASLIEVCKNISNRYVDLQQKSGHLVESHAAIF